MSGVIDEGEGPVLVFLHGAGVDRRLWEPQVAAFAATHRVIAPDLPGHGGVAPVGDVGAMAEVVHALLHRRGIERYAVIGLSLGGMVALEMAHRRPGAVTRLAMIEAVPRITDNRALLLVARASLSLLRLIPSKALSMLPASQFGAETPGAAAYAKDAMARMRPRDTCTVLRAALAYDGRAHVASLSMPVLVMVGERNGATHAGARAMVRAIPDCIFRVIPGAGHIANRDAADFTNEALSAFLPAREDPDAPARR